MPSPQLELLLGALAGPNTPRFAWILVEADHLGLGALLQPLVDHGDGSNGNHVAEFFENWTDASDAPVQLRRALAADLRPPAVFGVVACFCGTGHAPICKKSMKSLSCFPNLVMQADITSFLSPAWL